MVNEGTPILLNYILQRTVNNYADWLCMLWTNSSLSPVPTTVYASLTEATFTGYARKTLAHGTWQAPTIIASSYAESVYDTAPLSWTNAGVTAQQIYGYAVITPTSPKIMWLQQFDASFSLVPGGTVTFSPAIDLGTLP